MPQLTASAPWSMEAETMAPAFPSQDGCVLLPISVVVPVRNDARNLWSCLQSLQGLGEIYVVDSGSTDESVDTARSFGAKVVQFQYRGGWPKKRQWALDTLPFKHDWVLLLDADESLTPELIAEIRQAISDPKIEGYYIGLEMHFLGKRLRYSGATFYKLSLFRRGKGHFECRAPQQDSSMCDMEVHEHVMVDGHVRKLKTRIVHRNIEDLSRYIQKHNEYSNWEVRVRNSHAKVELQPKLFGSQAARRRWLRANFFDLPGSPLIFFFYKYVLRLGFLDGMPGLIYCGFQATQFFHVKAKLYEQKHASANARSMFGPELTIREDANVRD